MKPVIIPHPIQTTIEVVEVESQSHESQPLLSAFEYSLNIEPKKSLFSGLGMLPAVLLGLILNVLDAMSYGIIIFPSLDGIPSTSMQAGISMFFVSTIISQIVYTCRSGFKGSVGSMMIEVPSENGRD